MEKNKVFYFSTRLFSKKRITDFVRKKIITDISDYLSINTRNNYF